MNLNEHHIKTPVIIYYHSIRRLIYELELAAITFKKSIKNIKIKRKRREFDFNSYNLPLTQVIRALIQEFRLTLESISVIENREDSLCAKLQT